MLKKIVSAAAAALMFVSVTVTAFAKTEYQETEVPVPPKMLVLGDSIATGYGLEGYSKDDYSKCQSYSNLLKEKYSSELPSDCGFTLKNAAKDGQTSEELLMAVTSGTYDKDLEEANCVIVSIGGNDLLHALWDTLKEAGIEDFQKPSAKELIKLAAKLGGLKDQLDDNLNAFDVNLSSIAKLIRSKTKGEVIFQTLYDPFENFSKVPGLSSISNEKIQRLNEIIKSHAGDPSSKYTVCDIVSTFEGKATELTRINSMDIHPTEAGHKAIFEQLDAAIRKNTYKYMKAIEVPDDPESKAEPADAEAVEKKDSSDSKDDKDDSSIWTYAFISVGTAAVASIIITVIKKKRSAK